MKSIKISILFIAMSIFGFNVSASPVELNDFISKTDAFLKANVNYGYVKYGQLKKYPATLNSLTEKVAKLNVDALTGDDQKAALINIYNLFVIKGIVDNYPTNSPKDITGFFTNKSYNIGGKLVSLDDIEKNMLISKFNDARLHFVLNCAANGCPALANEAYNPASLNSQLDSRTRKIMNSSRFIKLNPKGAEISELFKWYEADFVKSGQTVVDFINMYRINPLKNNAKLSYYTYDWKLNEIKSLRSRGGARSVRQIKRK